MCLIWFYHINKCYIWVLVYLNKAEMVFLRMSFHLDEARLTYLRGHRMSRHSTGYDQKVLGLMYFGIPRNEKFATFSIWSPFILMHFLHRCSSLLIPSKQKSSSWSPKYSFTACMTPSLLSEIPTTKVKFSALGTDRSQKGLNLENTGDKEGLRSRIQSQDCLNCPKTYAHSAGYISQVSPPITHGQTVHNLNDFICSILFGAPRPLLIFNALPLPPKFSSPFLHCDI